MLKTLATLLLVSGGLSALALDTAYAKAANSTQIMTHSQALKSIATAKKKNASGINDFGKVPRSTLISICGELGGAMIDEAEGTAACEFDGNTIECNAQDECVFFESKPR